MVCNTEVNETKSQKVNETAMKQNVTLNINIDNFGGRVRAIASKSHAHRLLIAGALSDCPTRLLTPDSSKDIQATVQTLQGLGAGITKEAEFYEITPIIINTKNSHTEKNKSEDGCIIPAEADCGESGSTLRFIIPIIGALGIATNITMHGRLSERPLSPMYEELISHGLKLSPQGSNPFSISGKLTGGEYVIAGNISSQFITGLLFALPLLDTDSTLHVTGVLQSRPYVDITLDVIRSFGIKVEEKLLSNGEVIFTIPGNQTYRSTKETYVDGDWSNAAFFLAAGAIGKNPVTVTGLNTDSLQGDKKILELLKSFGADVSVEGMDVTVSPAPLKAVEIDASDIPDLVPILSVVASVADGKTVIRNIERLRIKESDRVQTVISTLSALGADIKESGDSIVINGKDKLKGGVIDSFNDHRIAMSAAIAAIRADGEVTIEDAMAVSKSYPGFYEDLNSLSHTSSVS